MGSQPKWWMRFRAPGPAPLEGSTTPSGDSSKHGVSVRVHRWALTELLWRQFSLFFKFILEQGSCYSTLKGLVAAISACREGLGLEPVGDHRLVKGFLEATKWCSSTARPLVPRWDLAVVLDALSGPPFEPVESLDLNMLSLSRRSFWWPSQLLNE